jgi:hypothetical protein
MIPLHDSNDYSSNGHPSVGKDHPTQPSIIMDPLHGCDQSQARLSAPIHRPKVT